jgi:hypothetical protein
MTEQSFEFPTTALPQADDGSCGNEEVTTALICHNPLLRSGLQHMCRERRSWLLRMVPRQTKAGQREGSGASARHPGCEPALQLHARDGPAGQRTSSLRRIVVLAIS